MSLLPFGVFVHWFWVLDCTDQGRHTLSALICLTAAFSAILSRPTQGAASGKRPLSFPAEDHCTACGHHTFLTHHELSGHRLLPYPGWSTHYHVLLWKEVLWEKRSKEYFSGQSWSYLFKLGSSFSSEGPAMDLLNLTVVLVQFFGMKFHN